MHELGVLTYALRLVDRAAAEQQIYRVKQVTLQVGESSGYLPMFLHKLFPVAAEALPRLQGAELMLEMVPGGSLVVKDYRY